MSDVQELRCALAGRYRIERELGAGGMATVYAARDLKHDREVALKVLRPELSAALGVERFLREVRITARLDHPHILTLIDSGEAAGFLFYVLPYVKGESLRAWLNRERQLQIPDALRIATQVASALDYAHRHGVIHRDIKPENILLHEGEAMVADFGIALGLREAGEQRLTESGLSLGTPEYMSPEQAAGERDLDARADIYSLGALVYELLAGEPPHTGPTVRAVFTKLMTAHPTPLRTLRDTVPEGVDAAVTRALAKVPADRFATAGQFARALESSAVASTSQSNGSHDSIAVLPFDNLSADPENEYFSDGVTEEIINALTKVHALRVAARTSAFSFKGKGADVRTVGRQLNVSTVLEGSVRRAANRIRVTVQLINVADGFQLWSETYERQLQDVFAIQDEIARAIVGALRVKLLGAQETSLVRPPTDDVDAYTLYLKGRFYWNKRTEASLRKGAELFEQAIARDPTYVLAYVGLADSFSVLGYYDHMPPLEAFPRARAAALRALDLDRTCAEAYASLGYVRLYHDWKWREAEDAIQRALSLNPRYSTAILYYGNLLVAMGRPLAGRRAFEDAGRLDPLSLIIDAGVGWALYYARRYDEAIAALRATIDMEGGFFLAHFWLGWTYAAAGRFEESATELEIACALSARTPIALAALARTHAYSGKRDICHSLLEELSEISRRRYVPPYELAMVYEGLNETEQVYDLLARALADRSHSLALVGVDPRVDRLRGDARFEELIAQVGLPQAAMFSPPARLM
jgi:serine/threonine protein kinase/Tfp pilus assembly protein PilF